MDLPPLPAADRIMWQYGQQIDHYSPVQMRAYAAEAVRVALEQAHAAIDASAAKIVRNRLDGYPGGEDRILTLVERIQALDQYAADWRRWCIEAEAKGTP